MPIDSPLTIIVLGPFREEFAKDVDASGAVLLKGKSIDSLQLGTGRLARCCVTLSHRIPGNTHVEPGDLAAWADQLSDGLEAPPTPPTKKTMAPTKNGDGVLLGLWWDDGVNSADVVRLLRSLETRLRELKQPAANDAPSGVCDLCNAQVPAGRGTTFPADAFRQLVARGLKPPDDMLELGAMLSGQIPRSPLQSDRRANALAGWHLMVRASQTGWLLCPRCTGRTKGLRRDPIYDISPVTLTQTPKSSGCFIATAAYGSDMAPEVEVLRNFRDTVLLEYRIGRCINAAYMRLSPSVARMIEPSPVARRLVRTAIVEPLVRAVK